MLLLCGCTTRPDGPVPYDLARAHARHGQVAQAATASLTVVAERDGKRETPLTLVLKLPADGRLWLAVERHDYRICIGVIGVDGTARLYSPRIPGTGATRIKADDAQAPAFVRAARLLASELRDGPVPAGAGMAQIDDQVVRTRIGAIDYELTIVAGDRVTAKRISDAQGEVARLVYRGERVHDGLRRCEQAELHLAGDAATYGVLLNRLTPVGEITEKSLSVIVPEGTPELSLDDFVAGLEQLQ